MFAFQCSVVPRHWNVYELMNLQLHLVFVIYHYIGISADTRWMLPTVKLKSSRVF